MNKTLINTAFSVFISVCFLSNIITAQPLDSLRAEAFIKSADSLQTAREHFDRSDSLALQGIALFAQLKLWERYVKSYRVIYLNGYYQRSYSKAIPLIKTGLENLPDTLPQLEGDMYDYLGYMANRSGDVTAASHFYETCALKYRTANYTDGIKRVYCNLGNCYSRQGEYIKAIRFLNQSNYFAIKDADSSMMFRNYWNLALAYFHQDNFDQAKFNFSKAKTINNQKDGRYDYQFAQIELALQNYDQAFQLIQQSIQKAKDAGRQKKDYSDRERLIGDIYLAQGQFEKALLSYDNVLPSFEQHPNKRELAKLLLAMGDAQKGLLQIDQALTSYQNALQWFLPTFKNENWEVSPEKNQWNQEIWLMEVFQRKGQCFFEKYENKEEKKWLDLAEQHFQLAIDFIEYIKLNFDEIESKNLLGAYVHSFYEDLIKNKLVRFAVHRAPSYKEDAFQIAQKANAFILRDLLNEKQALKIAGIAPDTLDLLDQIQKEKMTFSRLRENAPLNQIDSLNNKLFQIQQKQRDLKRSIEKNHPTYQRLRNDLQVATVDELQAQLDPATLIIRYFLGKEQLYVFSVSKNDFNIDQIALPENFQSLIDQYRQSISDLDFIKDSTAIAEYQYLTSAHTLYQLLLAQTLDHYKKKSNIKRLRIIADGVLNTIPFQALLTEKSNSWVRSEPLLITKYAISYSYFCKMLLEENQETSFSNNPFMSFGLEFDDYTLKYLENIAKDTVLNQAIKNNLRAGSLTNLPFSDDEAKELAEMMHGKSWLNDQASKANFLEYAPKAGIIHTATHSILNQEDGDLSALVFIKTRDSLDNLLRQEDIYQMQLKAELIVLSACNTAYGKVQKGEGINSLARAFNFSGIPSMTATFWSIADESAKKMMLLYYDFLNEGMSKDVALQQAQLAYLQNDQLSSPAFRLPVYWAAWKPIGNNSPLQLKRNFNHWLGLFAVCGLIAVVFFVWQKRKETVA